VTIAQQPAMTETPVRRGPLLVNSPHELVAVEPSKPAWTLAKLAGLVAITAIGVTLLLAIVVGGVLFALLNFG
jgi:hypothetical protein